MFDETTFYQPDELDVGHLQKEDISHILAIEPTVPNAEYQIDSNVQEEPSGGPFAFLESTPFIFNPMAHEYIDDPQQQEDISTGDASIGNLSDGNATVGDASLLTPEQTPQEPAWVTRTINNMRTHLDAGGALGIRNLDLYQVRDGATPEGSESTTSSTRHQAHALLLAQVSSGLSFHSAFAAGIEKRKMHRQDLPSVPKTWKAMKKHANGMEFEAAACIEIATVERRKTFVWTRRHANMNILPLKWVFAYKFDTDGYLTKFKARVCVRGDLQETEQETYAATLAARTFRALMAIAAAFDLEMAQFDAVNAFVNSDIDEEILCFPPEGFERPGWVWHLRRALYGLKQSPVLWYRDLAAALEALGLSAVPGVNCLFISKWLMVFFYVDDVVALYPRAYEAEFKAFTAALLSRFEMKVFGDLKWFLGIRIQRDRAQRKVTLCQDAYIDKLMDKFNIAKEKAPKSPLPTDEISPADEAYEPTKQQILAYQQKIGSINYAAVVSRPDVAFAASKLASFLRKPTAVHQRMAERVLAYLGGTRNLGISYNGGETKEILICASDAAFADHVDTRKSSEGFLIKLYGGPIDWRASRQRTVTTSSTEAELLSLSTAEKEVIWWRRFFKAIEFDTEQDIVIRCDNSQTMRLLEKESYSLQTKLKHIDIHCHWLRQEVQNSTIQLLWTPTNEMPADGLTKALPAQKYPGFIQQLGLQPITWQDVGESAEERSE
jgi:Reverse transcriptase (RNA-dependent DNA polymerase)